MGKDEPNGLDPEELKELEQIMALQSKVTAGTMDAMGQTQFIRRSERIQVAGRLLASFYANRTSLALLVTNKHDEEVEHAWQTAINDAVTRADALLARIDETEKVD